MVVSIPHGYKQTEVGTIPEDWEIVSLGDVVDFLDGQRRPIKSSDRERMKGIYPYYGASGIVDYVNDYIFDEELILLGEDGENILSRSLPLAFRAKGKIWVNNHAHVIRSRPEMHIGYLAEYLESLDYKLLNSGTAQPKLNKQTCLKIKVAKPTKTEQTAIAKALSDADTWIESLIRLIVKKRQIKQGAMQRLLNPYEDGDLKERWVVKTLGDIAPLQRGFDLPNSKLEQGKYPVVYSNGVANYHIAKQVIGPGVITGRSGTIGNIHFVATDYWPHNTTLWVTTFNGNIPKFIFYLFKSVGFFRFATGSGVPTLNRNDAHSFLVGIPESPEEQTRIATILSEMDSEITQLETKLTKAKTLKQGMMQNLLTGKIRLVEPQEVNCADA